MPDTKDDQRNKSRRQQPPKIRSTLDVLVETHEGETIVLGIAKVRRGDRPVIGTPAVMNIDGQFLNLEEPTDESGLVKMRVNLSDFSPGKHFMSLYFPQLQEWTASREFTLESKKPKLAGLDVLKMKTGVRAVAVVEGEAEVQFFLDFKAAGEPIKTVEGTATKDFSEDDLHPGERAFQAKIPGDKTVKGMVVNIPEKPKPPQPASFKVMHYRQIGDSHHFTLCVKDSESKPLAGAVLMITDPFQDPRPSAPADKNGAVHHEVQFPGGNERLPVSFWIPGTDNKITRWIYPAVKEM